jgi:hypothetical protein
VLVPLGGAISGALQEEMKALRESSSVHLVSVISARHDEHHSKYRPCRIDRWLKGHGFPGIVEALLEVKHFEQPEAAAYTSADSYELLMTGQTRVLCISPRRVW